MRISIDLDRFPEQQSNPTMCVLFNRSFYRLQGVPALCFMFRCSNSIAGIGVIIMAPYIHVSPRSELQCERHGRSPCNGNDPPQISHDLNEHDIGSTARLYYACAIELSIGCSQQGSATFATAHPACTNYQVRPSIITFITAQATGHWAGPVWNTIFKMIHW